MSKSKGNELLQELYDRLNGAWYKQGKYAGQVFTQKQAKDLVERIKKEYEEDDSTYI